VLAGQFRVLYLRLITEALIVCYKWEMEESTVPYDDLKLSQGKRGAEFYVYLYRALGCQVQYSEAWYFIFEMQNNHVKY